MNNDKTEQPIPGDDAKLIAGIIQAQIGTPGQHDIICAHMEEYFKRWPNYRSKFTSLEWYHIFLDFSDKLHSLPPSPVVRDFKHQPLTAHTDGDVKYITDRLFGLIAEISTDLNMTEKTICHLIKINI